MRSSLLPDSRCLTPSRPITHLCSGTGTRPQDSGPKPQWRTMTQLGRGVCGWSPLPFGAGSGGDALACGNSREGWSGYLPSQGRSNIHFPILPGWARRGQGHWPSWGSRGKEEKHNEPGPSQRVGPTAFQSIWRKQGPGCWRWNVNPSVLSGPCPSRAAAEWAALGLQVPRTTFGR